jgi:hypothetical protein
VYQAREHEITLLSPHSAQQEERRGQRERDVERRGKSSPDTLCCADGVFKRLQAECTAVERKPAKFGPFAPWHGSLLSSKVILPLSRRDVHLVALVLTATHGETVDSNAASLVPSDQESVCGGVANLRCASASGYAHFTCETADQ